MRRFIASSLLSLAAVQLAPATLSAQDREVPYWASLDAEEVNMRVGPSPRFPIEWVYRREGLPVKVVRTMQGWRLVQDPQGEQGWIVARLLTRERHAIVIGEGLAQIRELPAEDSPLMWQVEPDVVGELGDCRENWCEFNVEGRAGWIASDRLWGPGEP